MATREWLRHHRTAVLLTVTILLGLFVPIPGYIVAGLFWSAGVHDLDSTSETIAFLAVLFGVSMLVWGLIGNAVLPRRTETVDSAKKIGPWQ